MPNSASYAAEPGKRLWAAGFDFLTVAVVFLVIAAAGEGLRVNLARWPVFAAVFFLYHFGCLLGREGRTLGKTAVDLCVISASGQPLSFLQCLIRSGVRAFPLALLGLPDIDILGALLLLSLVIAEVKLLERLPARQTVTDRLARSLVVNLPPLQPHRAPAIPMYSAADAEFGYPPRRPEEGEGKWSKRSNYAVENDAPRASLARAFHRDR